MSFNSVGPLVLPAVIRTLLRAFCTRMLACDSYLRGVAKIQHSASAKIAPATTKNNFRWRKRASTRTNSDSSLPATSGVRRVGRVSWSLIKGITLPEAFLPEAFCY